MADSQDEPAHTVLSVEQCLTTKNMAVFPQITYLASLVLYDCFLFPRMKSQLQRHSFWNVTIIQEQSLTVIHAILKIQVQHWQKHWNLSANSEGDKNKQLGYAYFSLWTQCGTSGYTLVDVFPRF